MASKLSLNTLFVLALSLFICVQGTLGEIVCENLNEESCAFAVSSTGKRCLLEKQVKRSGEEAYTCRSSEIEADNLKDYVETDECVNACGLDRKSLGISSDSLLDSRFAHKLCSTECYKKCSNVIDLYFSLAAGEGVFLPKFCEAQRGHVRREMTEFKSSAMVAPAPVHPVKFMVSDAPAMPPY